MRSSQKTIPRKAGLDALMDTFSNARELITSGNAHNFIVGASACPTHQQEQLVVNTFILTKNRAIPFIHGLSKVWESLVRFTTWINGLKCFTVNELSLNRSIVWLKESVIASSRTLPQLVPMKWESRLLPVPFVSIMTKLSKNVAVESKIRCC